MQVNYFMNGIERTKDNHEVCTQVYDGYENVYILDGKKVFGISLVDLKPGKIVKIAEMNPQFPLNEVGNHRHTAFHWTPVTYWCNSGEERVFLLNFISMFNESKQASIQAAYAHLLNNKGFTMFNDNSAEHAQLQYA
ncbi:hypothetical protein D7X33_18405 [Butyricicoccus sp. 1XD8-22]|nr:hypothetical protein D7X33_18405 [Butyricicoccus sp. 1XD8-22]